jgi:hypothetical protein
LSELVQTHGNNHEAAGECDDERKYEIDGQGCVIVEHDQPLARTLSAVARDTMLVGYPPCQL